MKNITVLVVLLLQVLICNAQTERYSKVKVFAKSNDDIIALAKKGISLENLEFKPGVFFIGEFSEIEIQIIENSGIEYEILVEDMSAFYKQRNAKYNINEINASIKSKRRNFFGYTTPVNFSLGSMGGYHTYQELLDELDNMKSLYPNLISTKQPIGTINSVEGRPVYWLRISNNPEIDQDKPQVLYTALIHARELVSMQQMLYQMWYLLENYGIDPEITYLVDNLEMLFIPCVNPDGYIYNEITNPNGGGLWRKNRSVNVGGSFGVDLNRNFGYMWGYDDSGSSPIPTSLTYRGSSAFSEPETQLVKQFCEERNISLALNNHTYSDLLIYPWGYANLLTPDADIFISFAELLTSENNYVYGTCYETLAYTANGGSDDWFYGEQLTKNKIFAFTPEAGSPSDGFWPQVSRIEEICAGHTGMNLYLARLALPYAQITDMSNRFFTEIESSIPFRIKSLGLGTPSNYTVSIQPISSNILSVGEGIEYINMNLLEEQYSSINISFKPSISNGEEVKFVLALNNGFFSYSDTITKLFGVAETIVEDTCDDTSNWTINGSWNTTTQYYFSPPTSINDSPNTNYPNSSNTHLTYNQVVDLSNAVVAYAEFMTRWDIEKNWDYAQFMVSTNGGITWEPLPGKHTTLGTSTQDFNKPLYHGTQNIWVKEEIDLSTYAGQQIMLRFRLVSDNTINGQGFFFDDFRIEALYASQIPQINLPSELSFPVGESLSIIASQYISNFNPDLLLTWEGNTNISIENDNWALTISSLEDNWTGSEEVTFTISGEFGESSSIVNIACYNINYIPIIVGQNEIFTYKNQPIDLELSNLIVDDEDNEYPEEFILYAYENNNYSLNNLTLTPELNFIGMLSVPVKVSDGTDQSELFNLQVEVRIPLSIIDKPNAPVNVYYNNSTSTIYINNPGEFQFKGFEIIDMQGRRLYSNYNNLQIGLNAFNLPKFTNGIYIVKLLGDHLYTFKVLL